MSEATAAPQSAGTGGFLGFIERAGNKVPHPVLMFLYLIIGVVVLSSVLAWAGVSVTETIAVPDAVEVAPDYYEDSTQPILEPGDLDYEDGWHLEEVTIPINGLLSVEGIRFIFTSFVPNFAGFGVVAVTFVALMGAGVAEASGLMAALIRLLVGASPRRLLAFILIFVGVLSSVASDAGYRIRERRPSPAGRHGRLLRRRRRDLHGQPHPRSDRRDDHRDHQRGPGGDDRGTPDHRRQLVLQHRFVGRAGHHRRDRHGAHRGATAGDVPAGVRRRSDGYLHRG
jgi:hypothetical protein